MPGFNGYDQWKTASPYDGEPDIIEEAEKLLKSLKPNEDEFHATIELVVNGLLDIMKDEGVI